MKKVRKKVVRHWVAYSSGRSFRCRCAIGRDHTGQEEPYDERLADTERGAERPHSHNAGGAA